MGLTTFGAIMGFAAEMVKEAEEIYQSLARRAGSDALKEVFEAFSGEEGRNHGLLMKTRRENVTEMILEPVSGLNRDDYKIHLKITDLGEDADLLRAALILEKRGKRFFQDASAKVPLPEVARVFRKMVQRKEENLEKLRALGVSQTFERKN
jgi:rubrerythrin